MYQDSDDDSGGEHKRDLFEEALEQIRSNKNITLINLTFFVFKLILNRV